MPQKKLHGEIRMVGPTHAIAKGVFPKAVKNELLGLQPVQYAVVAESRGRVVGFLRYEFDARGVLCAAGTWVEPKMRGYGIGVALWAHLLKRTKARNVWVKTVTPGGRALVTSLMRQFTRLRWAVVS